jgi:hypothetical protein
LKSTATILVAVAGIALGHPAVSAAQEVTGRLEGRVLANDSTPLGDVDVTVSGPSLLGRRSILTDPRGKFLVPALPVGMYRVQVRRIGFRPTVVDSVAVRLGVAANLSRIVLAAQALTLAELTITAEMAGLEYTETALRTVLDAATLDHLPLDRNYRSIALLAPDATPSFFGDGVNVGGGTGLENNYFVDGINVTSPINGATSMDLPYNFIQQIEVRSGGSSAGDALSLGGVVNLVTPAGGNRFKGQVYGFLSGDALQSTARPVSGVTQTGFSFYDVGASLSGPIVRDRLSFFAAYNSNHERRDYSYGFGTMADTRRQHLFAGKLTWHAGPRTTASLTVLGDPSRQDGVQPPTFSTGQVPLNPEAVAIGGSSGGLGLSLRAQHFVTPRLLVEITAARMSRQEVMEPATAAGSAPVLIDFYSGTMSGGHGNQARFKSWRTALTAAATLSMTDHVVRAGANVEGLSNNALLQGSRSTTGGFVQRVDSATYVWFEFDAGGHETSQIPSAFVQDAWQVTPRLELLAGLRWSRQNHRNVSGDSTLARIKDGLQPRLAVVFQPGRIGTQRLFASYARVADELALWNAQNVGPGFYCSTTYPQDPRTDTTGGVQAFCLAGSVAAPSDMDLKGLSMQEWGLGYERPVGSGMTAAVRLVRRSLQWVIEDGADSTGAFRLGNPGRGALANFPAGTRVYQALELVLTMRSVQISYVLSRTRGNYTGLFATDLRVPAPHVGPQFDFADQLVNGTGLLPNDRTHVLKAFGWADLPAGFAVGGSMLVASGTPLSAYGGIAVGSPYWGFPTSRGTAGRTPATWDLGVRLSYTLPLPMRAGFQSRALLDVQHLGSPRRAVDFDQLHFTCAANDQSCANASYGAITQYQPPMTARLGLLVEF